MKTGRWWAETGTVAAAHGHLPPGTPVIRLGHTDRGVHRICDAVVSVADAPYVAAMLYRLAANNGHADVSGKQREGPSKLQGSNTATVEGRA